MSDNELSSIQLRVIASKLSRGEPPQEVSPRDSWDSLRVPMDEAHEHGLDSADAIKEWVLSKDLPRLQGMRKQDLTVEASRRYGNYDVQPVRGELL